MLKKKTAYLFPRIELDAPPENLNEERVNTEHLSSLTASPSLIL